MRKPTRATRRVSLTLGEQVFLRHYNAETFHARGGPATEWLDGCGLDWNCMAVFQRWGAANDDRFLLAIDEDPLPAFQVPWSSRDEFLEGVHDLLEVYPDLKPLIRLTVAEGTSA